MAETGRRSRKSAKLLVSALRSLLGFWHVHGLIGRPLAGAVPSVAGWRLAGLPRALSAEQVRALLNSCDRSTVAGVRDFAILTMLVRLGMRRGEIAVLRPAGTRPRDLRSSYITLRVYEGVPLTTISKEVGTSIQMIEQHYAGVIENWDGRRVPAERQIRAARRTSGRKMDTKPETEVRTAETKSL